MEMVRYGFQVEDVIASGRITRAQIEALRERLDADANVPKLTDEQLALFALSCDLDIEFAVKTVNEYFNARRQGPELFDNRHLERPEIDYQLNVIEYSVFPERMDDGTAILFHRLHDTYFTHYHMENSMKLLFMTLDITVFDNPPTGLVILFDMKGVGMMHLTRVKLSAVRKFCHYLQEGLPVKLKEVHVMNTAYFIDKCMAIVKPFLKTELLEKIHFHLPSVDMEEFNKKHIPKRCLPQDFGGELPDTQELHRINTLKLAEMRPFFDAEERQRRQYYDNK